MAINESLVFDGLELNPLPPTSSVFSLDEFNPGNPRKRPEWVQGADADGAALVRDPLTENRTATATVRVTAATRDAVHDGIAQLVAKCEEAEQHDNGLPLVWTPADSTESFTLYVLSGEIGDIPITHESGYFANSVAVALTLTCKPFGYGNEIAGTPTTASTPLVSVALAGVPGDVPAEARIIVSDNGPTAMRRDVTWGLEQHDYNAGAPASLLLAAGSLTTTGFSGTATTRAAAYLSNVISVGLFGQPTAICGTGNQPHIGTFRVRARVQATSTNVRVRLAWQDGDGPLSTNVWASPPAADNLWCELDLGLVTITPATAGTQRWTGRVEAYSGDGTAQTLYLNYLAFIPAGEGYGRARGIPTSQASALTAYDDFASATLGTTLNGRVPALGAAWATTGTATDFTAFDAPSPIHTAGQRAMARTTGADTGVRLGTFGAAMTDMEVRALVRLTSVTAGGEFSVIARYVDASNYLKARFGPGPGGAGVLPTLQVYDVNAGTPTFLAGVIPPASLPNQWYEIRLLAYASGTITAALHDAATGQQLATVSATSTRVATGGALASGKPGISDMVVGGTAFNRYWDDISVFVPPAEPVAIYLGRSLEFRHDTVIRYDSTGTYAGRPSTYRGGRALVPPAGDDNRTTRVVVAARANDTDTTTDGGVTLSTTLQVNVTPRFLVVPH